MQRDDDLAPWAYLAHCLVLVVMAIYGWTIWVSSQIGAAGRDLAAMSAGALLIAAAVLTGVGMWRGGQHRIFRHVRVAGILANVALMAVVVYVGTRELVQGLRPETSHAYSMLSLVFVLGLLGFANCVCLLEAQAARRPDPMTCIKCGYDLRGSDSSYCPECGHRRYDAASNGDAPRGR